MPNVTITAKVRARRKFVATALLNPDGNAPPLFGENQISNFSSIPREIFEFDGSHKTRFTDNLTLPDKGDLGGSVFVGPESIDQFINNNKLFSNKSYDKAVSCINKNPTIINELKQAKSFEEFTKTVLELCNCDISKLSLLSPYASPFISKFHAGFDEYKNVLYNLKLELVQYNLNQFAKIYGREFDFNSSEDFEWICESVAYSYFHYLYEAASAEILTAKGLFFHFTSYQQNPVFYFMGVCAPQGGFGEGGKLASFGNDSSAGSIASEDRDTLTDGAANIHMDIISKGRVPYYRLCITYNMPYAKFSYAVVLSKEGRLQGLEILRDGSILMQLESPCDCLIEDNFQNRLAEGMRQAFINAGKTPPKTKGRAFPGRMLDLLKFTQDGVVLKKASNDQLKPDYVDSFIIALFSLIDQMKDKTWVVTPPYAASDQRSLEEEVKLRVDKQPIHYFAQCKELDKIQAKIICGAGLIGGPQDVSHKGSQYTDTLSGILAVTNRRVINSREYSIFERGVSSRGNCWDFFIDKTVVSGTTRAERLLECWATTLIMSDGDVEYKLKYDEFCQSRVRAGDDGFFVDIIHQGVIPPLYSIYEMDVHKQRAEKVKDRLSFANKEPSYEEQGHADRRSPLESYSKNHHKGERTCFHSQLDDVQNQLALLWKQRKEPGYSSVFNSYSERERDEERRRLIFGKLFSESVPGIQCCAIVSAVISFGFVDQPIPLVYVILYVIFMMSICVICEGMKQLSFGGCTDVDNEELDLFMQLEEGLAESKDLDEQGCVGDQTIISRPLLIGNKPYQLLGQGKSGASKNKLSIVVDDPTRFLESSSPDTPVSPFAAFMIFPSNQEDEEDIGIASIIPSMENWCFSRNRGGGTTNPDIFESRLHEDSARFSKSGVFRSASPESSAFRIIGRMANNQYFDRGLRQWSKVRNAVWGVIARKPKAIPASTDTIAALFFSPDTSDEGVRKRSPNNRGQSNQGPSNERRLNV